MKDAPAHSAQPAQEPGVIAGVVGRRHYNRHNPGNELSESGAGDDVIMSIAGYVSRAMLSRYSHVRKEAKRRALDEIAARQRAADEKRKEEAERQHRTLNCRSNLRQLPSLPWRPFGDQNPCSRFQNDCGTAKA
ncbi:MAG TPA: hypothetical protein VMI94_29030 [Bryobacteraceae bacterium]|nr:hypothetical protein [Bryobacteraceae bacterium]